METNQDDRPKVGHHVCAITRVKPVIPFQHQPNPTPILGSLVDGTVFDSSYERGQPTMFAPMQVIKAWTEAMQLMKPGDKWELYCPPELAYGNEGRPG